MRKIVVTFLASFALFSVVVKAQDYTITPANEMMAANKKLLLVPFDPTLYMSDFDKEVSEASKMTYAEMREKYRNELDYSLSVMLSQKYASESILRKSGEESIKDMNTVRAGVKYEWVAIDKKKHKEGNNENNEQVTKQKISKGELVVKPDNTPKYMRVKVTNHNLLRELSDNYGSEYFVFVNQFELKNAFKDQLEIMRNTYKREVRVHYSVLDINGREIDGGIAVAEFDNSVNDIETIIKSTFPKISEQVLASVPGIGKAKEEKRIIPKF